MTERLPRADADTLLYRFTVDDPTTFTRPWSGEVPFEGLDELIYEYACHEGNYALSNVLSGERCAGEGARRSEEAPSRSSRRRDDAHDSPGGLAAGLVLAATVPMAGHHAFGAEFDPNAPIRLQGKVVKLEWVNPHAWIHIEVQPGRQARGVDGRGRHAEYAAPPRPHARLARPSAPSSSSTATRPRTTR